MKTVILAGGLGSRLCEETDVRPKPMVEIGGRPILWHIMKLYAHHGISEFVVCLGYKGHDVKEYFANYFLHRSDVTLDLRQNQTTFHSNTAEPWKVTLVDTGLDTQTAARVKRARKYIGDGAFLLTYGDGLADIDIQALMAYHRSHGKLCTITSVQPDVRFGVVELASDSRVITFKEKPQGEGSWINAGFFVCEPGVLDYISDDPGSVLEKDPLERLAREGQLYAYRHRGFWKCMDTLRDKLQLEHLWQTGAPWKVWED